MKIAWATDTHLDHATQEAYTRFVTEISDADLVLLTGDIGTGAGIQKSLESLVCGSGSHVAYVLGNHDYWGSSIADVRAGIDDIIGATYLHGSDPIQLGPDCQLVGCDGLYDSRAGRAVTRDFRPLVAMNDWFETRDFRSTGFAFRHEPVRYWPMLQYKIRAIADESARTLEHAISMVTAPRLVIATHCPPWPGAAPGSGQEHLPFFVSVTVGDAITRAVDANQTIQEALVLCGHTHAGCVVDISPTIRCVVGAARYREPAVQD